MSHIVLARKYRPKSFEEVIGQDNSVLILQSFISNDSIPHSLIFLWWTRGWKNFHGKDIRKSNQF